MSTLQTLMASNLQATEAIIKIIKERHLENSQDALNWIDSINKLSVEF